MLETINSSYIVLNHLLHNFSDEVDFEMYGADRQLQWCPVRNDDGQKHKMSLVLH